MVNSITYLLL